MSPSIEMLTNEGEGEEREREREKENIRRGLPNLGAFLNGATPYPLLSSFSISITILQQKVNKKKKHNQKHKQKYGTHNKHL